MLSQTPPATARRPSAYRRGPRSHRPNPRRDGEGSSGGREPQSPLFAGAASTHICFAIAASGVKVHLNGYTIRGSDIPSVGIDASTGLTNDEVLGPGTVTGWQRAGVIFGASSLHSKGAVRAVLATHNAVGIEITGGEGTAVNGNVARHNKFGIVVRHGANHNRIEGNIALHNKDTDLSDHNPNCGDNVWRGNDFATAFPSPSCID